MPAKGGKAPWLKNVTAHTSTASGIPAWGESFGGAPKPLRIPFSADNQPPPEHKRAGHMEHEFYREGLKARLAANLDIYTRAQSAEAPLTTQLVAAKQIEDRYFGQAKQTIAVEPDTRTDDQLVADIKAKRLALGIEDDGSV